MQWAFDGILDSHPTIKSARIYPKSKYNENKEEAPLERITVDADMITPDETAIELRASSDGATWHKLPYIINQTSPEPANLSATDQVLLTVGDDTNHQIIYDGILKAEDNLITDVVGNIHTWTSTHRAIFESIILYRAIDCWHNIELIENGEAYTDGIPFDEGQYGESSGLYFTYLYADEPVSRLLIVPYGATVYFKPPSSNVYTERKPTNYEYYTIAQLDLEAGENALSLLMPETGNWRTIYNEHLGARYLHRYIDGQAEQFMPIPIHHFPEVMSAFPRMRLADGYYNDPVKYMTQFALSQEVDGTGEWTHELTLFEHKGYPKLKPPDEVLWLRYRYIDAEEFKSMVYVKATLSTRNRYVTPVVRNIKAINSYW